MIKYYNENEVMQCDNTKELLCELLSNYIDAYKYDIEIDVVQNYCELCEKINKRYQNILHIVIDNYNDTICVYCNNDIVHICNLCDIDFHFVDIITYNSYDDFLRLNDIK